MEGDVLNAHEGWKAFNVSLMELKLAGQRSALPISRRAVQTMSSSLRSTLRCWIFLRRSG